MQANGTTVLEILTNVPEDRKEPFNKLHNVIVKKLPEGFEAAIRHSKQKLDMGKSCVRFKKLDEIPYELIGELMKKMSAQEWINIFENPVSG